MPCLYLGSFQVRYKLHLQGNIIQNIKQKILTTCTIDIYNLQTIPCLLIFLYILNDIFIYIIQYNNLSLQDLFQTDILKIKGN